MIFHGAPTSFFTSYTTPYMGATTQSPKDPTYNGDGQRVKSAMLTNIAETTTYFVGNYYEVTGTEITKYYFAGSQRIAMRKNGALSYLIGDYLGSTSIVTDASGVVISQQQYKAWGETRYASGSEATKYQYTGQYSYASDFGLMFYNARWYDSSLGRFAQADSVVPGGVQGYDRYAYVNNNPMRYTDPSGHMPTQGCGDEGKDACHASDLEKSINARKLATIEKESQNRKCAAGNKNHCADQSDADLYSYSFSAGVGPWFVTRSIDILITHNNQLGVFTTSGYGPGFGIFDSTPWNYKYADFNDYKGTFMTPQLGGTFWVGKVHGESLIQDVINYEGVALQGGGGGGPFSYETFSSTNKDTKMADGKIWGEAIGVGVSMQPAEVHVNYSNATYRPTLSNIASWVLGY